VRSVINLTGGTVYIYSIQEEDGVIDTAESIRGSGKGREMGDEEQKVRRSSKIESTSTIV
jgi:hypothetical protein